MALRQDDDVQILVEPKQQYFPVSSHTADPSLYQTVNHVTCNYAVAVRRQTHTALSTPR